MVTDYWGAKEKVTENQEAEKNLVGGLMKLARSRSWERATGSARDNVNGRGAQDGDGEVERGGKGGDLEFISAVGGREVSWRTRYL